MARRRKTSTPDLLPGMAERIEVWTLDRLRPYERNPWRHPEAQIDRLAAGIRRFGFNAPILVQGDSIVAGHARLAAARRLGLEAVPVVPLDHLDTDTARAYRIADNRLAEFAELDEELLAGELDALEDLELLEPAGWTEDELADLRDELEPEPEPGPEPDGVDDPYELQPIETPVLRTGDLLELGAHRLLVGDAFDEEAIARLLEGRAADAVITDPPYAIFGSSTGVESEVADDKMVRPFFERLLRLLGASVRKFGHAYTFTDWRSFGSFVAAGRSSPLTLSNVLVWDKGDYGLGSTFRNCHEFVAFWQRLPRRSSYRARAETGQRAVLEPNILRFPRTRSSAADGWTEDMRRHSAAKPPRLIEQLVRYSTDEGERVLDPMVGTETTLIACERTSRRGLAMEIEPVWAEVAARRWERVSGERARLAGSGATLEDLAERE